MFIEVNNLRVKECTTGDNHIIAAGSVIIKDISNNWIVGGIPAKKIGEWVTDE